jgi:hypothetical protein
VVLRVGDGCTKLSSFPVLKGQILNCRSFILEGLLTVIVAILSYFCVWDEPATASFLTEDEKEALLDALQPVRIGPSTNPQLGHGHSFKWKHVAAALVDWQVGS